MSLWAHDRHYIIIQARNGIIYHFNRGLIRRLSKITIDAYAEQVDLEKWVPKILINELVIVEGESLKSREAALEYFESDIKTLSALVNGRVRRSYSEWREWYKRYSRFAHKLRRIFQWR